MTEEIAATPGWVEVRLDEVFAPLPHEAKPILAAYARCLASGKAPGAPSDMLGAEFNGCRAALRRGLVGLDVPADVLRTLDGQLEALEAEIAEGS